MQVERWSDGFVYEPVHSLLGELRRDGLVVRVIQCVHWIKIICYDESTGETLNKWSLEASHYYWLLEQGMELMDMGKFLEASKKKAARREQRVAPQDESFGALYPAMWEFFTETKWGKDEPRETSTLLVFVEAGMWKACFNDRDQERTMWASNATFEGLLASLEAKIASGEDDWRDKARNDVRKQGSGKGR